MPNQLNYLPTPIEIAAQCRAIQAGWSERERAARAPHLYPARWLVPVLHAGTPRVRALQREIPK